MFHPVLRRAWVFGSEPEGVHVRVVFSFCIDLWVDVVVHRHRDDGRAGVPPWRHLHRDRLFGEKLYPGIGTGGFITCYFGLLGPGAVTKSNTVVAIATTAKKTVDH